LVMFDAGHGGKDAGAMNGDIKEKDITLAIILAIRKAVFSGDYLFDPITTRITDRYLPLSERTRLSNDKEADLFISIHCNAAEDRSASGYEIFHVPGVSHSTYLANDIHDQISCLDVYQGHKDRGIKEAEFYVLVHTLCPAVLFETEFLSNTEMLNFLVDPMVQKKIARAIADGAEHYLEG
jgi:N-acetylmuramoyl-L-alanine amidase